MTRIRWFLLALTGAVVVLAIAVPNVAQAGGGCHTGPTSGQGSRVDLRAACFGPTLLHVRTGETVTWTNRDSMAHMVTGANASWGDYSELYEGDSVSHEFAMAGTYPYHCLLHPGMIGAVVVEDGEGEINSESVSLVGGRDDDRSSVEATEISNESHAGAIALLGGIAAVVVIAGAGGFAAGSMRRVRRRTNEY